MLFNDRFSSFLGSNIDIGELCHATALAVARRTRVAEHALRRTRVCHRAHDDDILSTHPVAS